MKSINEPNKEALDKIALAISTFGRIYNGFDCIGAEHIPQQGPALVCFYHGLLPLDAWYFGLEHYLKTGRLIRGLGDRWLFKTPGLKQLVKAVGAIEGTYPEALELLKQGHLVGVSPGGTREAISGTSNNYKLIWKNRTGFAKLAIEAKVDIIPGFTRNVEELYRAPFADSSIIQTLYEKTRWPILPVIGLGLLPFPVKLTTVIGKPIKYDPNDTPATLSLKTKSAIENLIQSHQPNKQSVLNALKERYLK